METLVESDRGDTTMVRAKREGTSAHERTRASLGTAAILSVGAVSVGSRLQHVLTAWVPRVIEVPNQSTWPLSSFTLCQHQCRCQAVTQSSMPPSVQLEPLGSKPHTNFCIGTIALVIPSLTYEFLIAINPTQCVPPVVCYRNQIRSSAQRHQSQGGSE